jgi:predicted Zn-dependent protease
MPAPRSISVFSYVLLGTLMAACSSGSGRNLLALENEKTELRAAIATKIGASPQEVEQAFNSTSKQERKTANAVTQSVKQRYGTTSDLVMQAHLQNVANRLAQGLNADAENFKVVLIKNYQINAFTPGAGIILINEGLLQLTQNEAQVAAVIGHEMAHVLMKHPQRQKQIRLASKAGGHMMDEFTPKQLQDNIGQFLRLGGNATLNGMIRQQEMMADSVAIDMLVKAGYNPRAMVEVLHSLRAQAPPTQHLYNIVYGNHPPTIDREKAAIEKINLRYQAVSGTTSTPQFDALIKSYRLKRVAQRN